MKYILSFLLCCTALAQQTVNNFAVKTNLTVAGTPVTLSVNSIADLRALTPVVDNMQVSVAGYYLPGDGGGGIYALTNSIAGTNQFGGKVLASGGTKSWQLVQPTRSVDILQFGGVANDGVSDAPQMQSALDWLHDQYGGTLTMPAGVFHSDTTINIPYRVSIRGSTPANFAQEFSASTNDTFYLLGSRTWIRLMANANVPLIKFNSTDGYIVQPAKQLEDGEIVNGVTQDSTIQNLVLYTRPQEQSVFNADAIYAMSKWGITIRDCVVFGFPGYQLRALDCNALMLKNVYFKGSAVYGTRGAFVWSCADCNWDNVSIGGVAGPAIWLSESWKIQGVNMYPWNSLRTNSAYQSTVYTTNGFTLSASTIAMESGDPVMVRNYDWVQDGTWRTNVVLGTLPTGITSTNLYFAVKLTPTTFGIHTNRALALAGQTLPIAGATGTNWLNMGYGTGMFFSSNTRQNNFEGVRADQHSDHGIVFQSCFNNTIAGLTANSGGGAYNGETNIQSAGVYFGQYAVNNSVQSASVYDYFFGGYAESTASGNMFDSMYRFIYGGATAQSFDSTPYNNSVPLLKSFNGIVSSQTINALTSDTITLGNASLGRVLDIYGNSGGNAAIRITRSGSVTNEIGVSAGSFQFKNVQENVTYMNFSTGATRDLTLGNNAGSSSTKTGRMLGEPGTGTDIAGGNVHVRSGIGTGAGSGSTIQFYTPTVGSTGSSAQSEVERARFSSGTAAQDSGMLLWDRDTSSLRRVGVTNLTLSDGVLRSYLYLK